ncbi:hypothetical protein [Nonlabens agnitus]|uniref:hypothetical protein n=1 Tax=Nonlabens agnitus TaxID=870484 RepID=UPI00155A03E4|nr:hypothetical protein [Nonlabens agnitus]
MKSSKSAIDLVAGLFRVRFRESELILNFIDYQIVNKWHSYSRMERFINIVVKSGNKW